MIYKLRLATPADAAFINELIGRSIRVLGARDYGPDQIEGALTGAFGLDTTLIRDGTYYVATDEHGRIVGCGGWSFRRTLFGSDARSGRDENRLDPARDAAKIRAFFIDPEHARRGIGRQILERSEADARQAGFFKFEMMATLTGRRLYERCGYVSGTPVQHPLPGGQQITFVPMSKAT